MHDPSTLGLLEELVQRHCCVYLFLHDIWELEEVKQLEAYDYICEVIYGNNMLTSVLTYMQQSHQSSRKVVMFTSQTIKNAPIDVVCMNEQGYVHLEQYMNEQVHEKRKGFHKLLGIMLVVILYFTLYFIFLDQLPSFMQDGFLAMMFVLIPAIILVVTFFYGLYCGVMRWSVLLDLFDFL